MRFNPNNSPHKICKLSSFKHGFMSIKLRSTNMGTNTEKLSMLIGRNETLSRTKMSTLNSSKLRYFKMPNFQRNVSLKEQPRMKITRLLLKRSNRKLKSNRYLRIVLINWSMIWIQTLRSPS